MAQCPNCHAKLHVWNVKAECPHCHANIPNHNWEQRLDADADTREAAFYKMHTTLAKLKYAVIGTPLHLIRLICCVLPLLGYLLPMAHVIGEDAEGDFSLLSMFTGNKELFAPAHLPEIFNWGSPAQTGLLRALLLAAAALVCGVVAFFLVPILFKHPKSPAVMILHLLSFGGYTAGVFLAKSTFQSFGNGSLQFAVWLGVAAFSLVFVLDVILLILPVNEEKRKYVPKDELQIEYAKKLEAEEMKN